MPIKFTNKDENFFKKNGYLIKKTNNYKSLDLKFLYVKI